MKVILIKDVKKLGKANEVVTTADGYALNFLIPQKLAIPATGAAVKEAELRQNTAAAQGDINEALLLQNVNTLTESELKITRKANEKGHLYDAVNVDDIVAAVKEFSKIEIPAHIITLEKPIKEVGTFPIPVTVGESSHTFNITIEAEK